MSGPNPPGPDTPGSDEPGEQPTAGESTEHVDEPGPERTGETEVYSQAYSAPESEQFVSSPYLPADAALYDFEGYESATELVGQQKPPRWPWVVGVTAIIAAIALVISVTVLVARTDTDNLADPETSSSTAPPVQDEITTTTPPPPPPPSPTEEPPPPPPPPTEEPPPPPETVTVTEPPPPPPTSEAPPPPPTSTTPAGPRQITYSVTGTKAPGDIITVTFMDSSGNRKTQRNVVIPWAMTVTPISRSDVGSVEASSLFLVSRLNCSITASDGTVLSSNTPNAARTSC
jgi:hypothetical protein